MDLFKTNGTSPPQPGFELSDQHCTLYLLRPLTRAAHDWVDDHLPEDAMDWCGAIVVEHRDISDIVRGAIGDGLVVR